MPSHWRSSSPRCGRSAAGVTHVLAPAILFGILFLVFVTAVIFRSVVMSPEVTTYLFLGLIWGWAYALLEQLHPGSFRSMLSADGRTDPPQLTFLSFITLTSVGYGDLVPASAYARSLALLEAVTGQMYLAVFIARLVGLHAQRGKPTFG